MEEKITFSPVWIPEENGEERKQGRKKWWDPHKIFSPRSWEENGEEDDLLIQFPFPALITPSRLLLLTVSSDLHFFFVSTATPHMSHFLLQ